MVRLLPTHGPYPSHLPHGFVEWVREREDRGDFAVRGTKGRLLLRYRPDEQVPILHGAFAGLPARFVRQVRDNCDLLIGMLGSDRPVSIPVRHIRD